MRDHVRDFGEKLEHIATRIFPLPSVACILAELYPDHRPGAWQKTLAHIADVSDGSITNWKNTWNPPPGAVVDLSIICGFCPDEATILQLIDLAEADLTQRLEHPEQSYLVLDQWNNNSVLCNCWRSFAGLPSQLVTMPKSKQKWTIPPRERGLDINAFKAIVDASLQDLDPRMPDAFFTFRGRPKPQEITRRRDRTSGAYDVLTKKHRYATSEQSRSRVTFNQFDLCSGAYPLRYNLLRFPPASTLSRVAYPAILNAMSFDPPTVPRSRYTMSQKASLYGGLRRIYQHSLSPLEYVTLNLTAERQLATAIYDRLQSDDRTTSSFTISSGPGQGKSILLYQLVRKFCARPGWFTLWSVGEEGHASLENCELNYEQLAEYLKVADFLPDRLLFVIDDFDKLENERELFRFYRCWLSRKDLTNTRVTFLFSSCDTERGVFEDEDVFRLVLTDEDEESIYDKMANDPPRIITPRYDNIGQLHESVPGGKRIYKDDIHGFIDYLIENSEPNAELTWLRFSVRGSEEAGVSDLLCVVAASQILDAPVPLRAARRAVGEYTGRSLLSTDDMWAISPKLAFVKAEWPGLGLSSPYHAALLLRHEKKLTEEAVGRMLSELIYYCLEELEDKSQPWYSDHLEYMRHILQRLCKQELYGWKELSSRSGIADRLVDLYGPQLFLVVERTGDAGQYARWAGTLCSLPDFHRGLAQAGERTPTAEVVLRLCELALEDGHGRRMTPAQAVSLLRATNRLAKEHWRSVRVQKLVINVRRETSLRELLFNQLSTELPEAEYRANELVHTYIKFLKAMRRRTDVTKNEIAGLLQTVEEFLATYGNIQLDAGNWLEWADALSGDTSGEAVELQAKCLNLARQSVRAHVRRQGTWGPRVTKEIKSFLSQYPEYDRILR